MRNIIFFNHFNNGDIHVSRNFVKFLISKIKSIHSDTKFFYTHKNDPNLLNDIEDLSYDGSYLKNVKSHYSDIEEHQGNLYLNTWYGSQQMAHLNKYGITFDCLYGVFSNLAEKFKVSLDEEDPYIFFPSIDYTGFYISQAQKFVEGLEKYSNKMILVANGLAKSGQAADFNLSQVALDLSKKYKGLVFVLTNKNCEPIVSNDNIFYSQDIIKKHQGSDLNENSYLSTYAEMIVGRSSGVFSFSFVTKNLFNRSIDFISFSNLSEKTIKYWLSNKFQSKIQYSAQIEDLNIKNSVAAFNYLDNKIKHKYT